MSANPVPIDFEQHQEKNEQQQQQRSDIVPTASIEDTTAASASKPCLLFEVIAFSWGQMKDFHTRICTADNVHFRVGMPILGLVVTLVALLFFICTVGYGMAWNQNYNYGFVLYFAYLVLAASVAFELWWGLKTNDKKHINVWILLKSLEILTTIYAFLFYLIYGRNKRFYSTSFYYVSIMGLNAWIIYSILQSAKPFKDKSKFAENSHISTIS